MQLEFKKQNGLYEVEFEVTGDFNLHLERKNYGRVELYQKTSSETNYTSSPSYSANSDAIINLDFSMGVYPKFVKIVSYTEVEKAIVTMEGESGSSGSGGGLRPVTAEDFSSIVLSNSMGSTDTKFSDTIIITGQMTITIRLNNKKADLVQPVKEECQLIYSGEERNIYYYRNEDYAPITFNMSQLYIKED